MYKNQTNKQRKHAPIVFLLAMLLCSLITACNDKDDINAIFTNQTWYLGDFYQTSNWKDDNNQKAIYSRDPEAMNMILCQGKDRFYISFQEERFTAKGTGNTFSGTWSADGKTNQVSFYITKGKSSYGTGLEKELTQMFYDYIKNGKFYTGNIFWLKIFPDDKKSFMQLTKNRVEK